MLISDLKIALYITDFIVKTGLLAQFQAVKLLKDKNNSPAEAENVRIIKDEDNVYIAST